MGCQETLNQQLRHLDQRLAIHSVFQTAKRRGRGQRKCFLGRLAGRHLQCGIIAERLLIVKVFIAQGDREYPLGQHFPLLVRDVHGVAWIRQAIIDRVNQPDASVDFSQQKYACIGCETTTRKIRDHLPPFCP